LSRDESGRAYPASLCTQAYSCTKDFEVTYSCSAAGWGFVAFVALGAVAYVGGGVLYAQRVQGRTSSGASSVQLHPHYSRWLEAKALVEDGVAHARGRAGGAARRAAKNRAGQIGSSLHEEGEHRPPRAEAPRKERREKRPKKEKKERGRKEGRSPREEPLLAASPAPAPAPASPTKPKSTASGGGGKWVHVSN